MNAHPLAVDSPGARLARSLALVTTLEGAAEGSLDALDRLLCSYQCPLATDRDPDLDRNQRNILSSLYNEHMRARANGLNELSYIDSLIATEMAHLRDQANQLKRLQAVHRTGQSLSWNQMSLPPSRRLRSREAMTSAGTATSSAQRPLSAPSQVTHNKTSLKVPIPGAVKIPTPQHQLILPLGNKGVGDVQQRKTQQKLKLKQLQQQGILNQSVTLKLRPSPTPTPANISIKKSKSATTKIPASKMVPNHPNAKSESKIKPYQPIEETYCICHQPSFGKMIACDDPKCSIEWYHLSCLHMKSTPKGKWICPICTKRNNAKRQKKRRPT